METLTVKCSPGGISTSVKALNGMVPLVPKASPSCQTSEKFSVHVQVPTFLNVQIFVKVWPISILVPSGIVS